MTQCTLLRSSWTVLRQLAFSITLLSALVLGPAAFAGRQVTTPPGCLLDLSHLGLAGLVGPAGPLGPFGPVGKKAWNPSELMKIVGDWSAFSGFLTSVGGPL